MPDGLLQGERFQLHDFQLRFLRDALAPGIREAGLCIGRKNGKSALVAILLLSYLCGPLHKPGWRGLVTSLTGGLAIELRNQIEAIAASSGLPVEIRRAPYPGAILGPNRTRVTILAADRATGHGLGVDLAIFDELGLVPESKRGLYSAVRSSVSARDGRTIAISIMGDPGSIMAEVKARSNDPAVCFHHYAADPGCKLDDRAAWHAANPGLGSIKSLSYMEDMARAALATAADAAAFRAYDQNQPVGPSREVIVLPEVWDRCETEDDLPERDGECVVGLDIGGSSSMTAAVAI